MSADRIPTIHPAGSSGRSLLDSHARVASALLDLDAAMRLCAPQERDFTQQGKNAWHHAMNEHEARLATLARLKIDYLELLDGISAQLDGPGFGAAVQLSWERLAR